MTLPSPPGSVSPDRLISDYSEYRFLGNDWYPDGTVTWSFAELHLPDDRRQDDFNSTLSFDETMRSITRDAFKAWEEVCGVVFVEVEDSTESNIRIGWQSDSLSDGAGGTAGLGGYGNVMLDPADTSHFEDEELAYDTILHEVGHALGLDHSDIENVVMSGGLGKGGPTPYWEGVPGRDPLQPDDIAGAVALWGPPGGPRPEPPFPSYQEGSASADTLRGGRFDDYVNGNGGDDAMFGGSGDDYLGGGDGNDSVAGGDGNDSLYGQGGNDSLTGGDANDYLGGGDGNDNVAGGDGNDYLWGGDGNDTLFGGHGDDTIFASGGDTIVVGRGDGHDTVYGDWDGEWSGTPEKIDLRAFGSGAPTWAQLSERLSEVAVPDGDGGSVSSARLDLADLGGGSITFWGWGLYFIDASDFIGLAVVPEPVMHPVATERGTDGADTLNGSAGNDNVYGEGGDDTVQGGAGADFLAGGAGDDSLSGEDGADYLAGEGGADTLDGGAGVDVLAGGDGNDTLHGGSEGDTFFGQEGADTFVVRGGVNWVMDFDSADRLDIGMSLTQVQTAATQQGEHLHIALTAGRDLYLANTVLAEVEADNLIV